MIHLQRASAGSGKTYALTGKYIKLLLGEKIKNGEEGERYKLRSEEALRHGMQANILAITFTNKATNEMKQRIIKALAALAEYDPSATKLPAYMDTLADCFGEPGHPLPYTKIQRAAQFALSELLNDYTEFQVSTIDSFFQTVLRSFAYETDLRNNYAVELEDKYIADMGAAATFDDLRDNNTKKQVEYWTKRIMNKHISKGQRWNLPERTGSAYKQLMKFLDLIVKEDFIKNRKMLYDYFSEHPDLIKDINDLDDKLKEDVEKKSQTYFTSLGAQAADIQQFIANNKLDQYLNSYLPNQLKKLTGLKTVDEITKDTIGTRYVTGKSPYNKAGKEAGEPCGTNLYAKTEDMYATLDKILHLNNELSSITSNLSYLGLLSLILFHIEKFRLDNNIVQLSDTNSILRQIINKEDTPFIYEKIGTAIHHYLIDEFQDTSQMQWENMLPLLQESLGHNHENLVIGDAKQSIYRFRNADFSIITTNVQESFRKDQLGIHGTTPAENANWRSSKDIVAFNNHFFRAMINDDIIHLDSSGDKPVEDIKALYLNCEQMAKEVSRQGYVEIVQRPEKDTTDDSGDGSAEENKDEDSKKLAPMTEVAPIVCELLSRGYQQKEIAVLVRTNKQGVAVIDGLMKYNSERGKDDPMIDFVSGESLYINRAKSVGIIIAVLEAALQRNIAKIFERAETDPDADHQATQELRAKINSDAEAFVNAIHRYRGEHTEASIVDAMQQYFDGNIEQLTVDDLLKDMDNMLLQAQVESIIGSNFISPTLRKVEAPYIAAFQDKVCDYCENYGSDTAAFLSWWHDNGDKFTIATPEGSDAVNIMTIHKSKGLEFRCVIIPYTDFDYGKINESVWVSPSDLKEKYPTQYPDSVLIKYADELPPWIPMKVSSSMVGTPLESEYISRANRVTIDALNALYVGFTRAVDELYIFYTPKDGKTVTTTTAAIQRYIADYESSFVAAERAGMTRMQKVGSKTTEVSLMSYAKGQKPTSEEVARNRKEKNEEAGRVEMIDSYYVCGSLPSELQFRDVDGVDYVDDFSDEDNNQRERGNILHSVMQYITTQSTMERDIDFALLRAHVRGFISKNVMKEMRKFLLEKLSAEKPREWFRDGLQVINERNLLAYDRFGGKNRRPDRIIVTPHGDATIIDFKFGKASEAELRKYRKQVKEYMSMLEATKMYRSVTGWIWFVALDLYEPVV